VNQWFLLADLFWSSSLPGGLHTCWHTRTALPIFWREPRQWLGSSFLGSLMDCFNCISIWVAAPLALYISHEPLRWLLVWLATSGAVCLLEKIGPEPVFIEQIPKLHEGEPDHGMLRPETRTDIESTNCIVENEPIH
jgi:hypothetical protein